MPYRDYNTLRSHAVSPSLKLRMAREEVSVAVPPDPRRGAGLAAWQPERWLEREYANTNTLAQFGSLNDTTQHVIVNTAHIRPPVM